MGSISNGYGWGVGREPCLWRLRTGPETRERVASHAAVMINTPSSALSLGWHSESTHSVKSTLQLSAQDIIRPLNINKIETPAGISVRILISI